MDQGSYIERKDPAHLAGCVINGNVVTCAEGCPRFAAVSAARALLPIREPDTHGVAVGDLVIGQDVHYGHSSIGAVARIFRHYGYPERGDTTYEIACAELYPTGIPAVRMVEAPSVIKRVGEPIVCGRCRQRHETAAWFVSCQVAHLRADVERVAERLNA